MEKVETSSINKMSSSEFVSRVDELYKRMSTVKVNKHAIRYVAWYFQNPQSAYKVIHVSGTNGKGSV
jgi:folylpolyglutamate synthase/dihydropteroate synthase